MASSTSSTNLHHPHTLPQQQQQQQQQQQHQPQPQLQHHLQGSLLPASQHAQQPNQHNASPHQIPTNKSSTSSFLSFSPPGVGFKSQNSGSTLSGGVGLDSYRSTSQSSSQNFQQNSSSAQEIGASNSYNPPSLQNPNSFGSSTGAASVSSYQAHQGQQSQQQQPQSQSNHTSALESQNQLQHATKQQTDDLYTSLLSQQLLPQPQMSHQVPDAFVMTSHTAGNTKVSPSSDYSTENARGTFGQSQGFGSGLGSNSVSGSNVSKLNHSGPGFWDVSNEIGGTGLRGSQRTSGSSNAPPGSESATAGVIARPTPPGQGYQPPHQQQSQHDRSPSFGGESATGLLPTPKAPQNQSSANYIQSQPQYSASTSNISQPSQSYSGLNSSTTNLPSVIGIPQSNSAQQRQPSPSVFPLPLVGSHQQPSGSYFPQNSQQQPQQQQSVSQRNSQISSRSPPHVQAANPGTSQSPHYSPLLQHRQNDGSPHHSLNQHTSPQSTAVIGSPHGSITGTVNPGSAGTKASGRGSLYSPPPAPSQNAPSVGPSGHAGAGSDRGNAGSAAAREREREHREREQREQRDREHHEKEHREREHHYDHHQPPLGGANRQTQQLRFAQPSGLGRSGGMAIDTSNIQNLTSPIIVQNPTSGGPLSPNTFSPNASGGTRDPITLSSNNPALHRALLTPITHPAPPPAPSAPPTASTPGTDYYYWGQSSATSTRWGDREEEGDYGTPTPGPAPSTMTSLRGIPGPARQAQKGGLIGLWKGQGVGDDVRRIPKNGPPSGGLSGGMDLGGFSGTSNADRNRDRERDDELRRERPQASPERPQSVGDDPEFDTDPIPAEYRPIRRVGEEEKGRGSGSGSNSQNQGPPPRPHYQQGYVPQNVNLHHGNAPNSPPSVHAHIGYSNAQYTSRSQQGPARITGMQSSSASSSTTTLPTSNTTTQAATRESIMRGQWVGGTAAVAGPAPITHSAASSTTGGHQRKPSENTVQQQMQERPKQPGSIGSSVIPMREQPKRMFSTDTINSQEWSHVSPVSSGYHGGYQPPQNQLPPMSKSSTGMTNTTTGSFIRAEDMLSNSLSPDKLELTTNPSAVPSPELFQHHHPLQHRPVHQQRKSQQPAQGQPHRDRSVSADEEKLVSILKGLYKVLPDSHIRSLHNFALYLSEDALAAEKAQRLLNGEATPSGNRGSWGPSAMGGDVSDRESRLDVLSKERLRRWNEWVEVEEAERRRHVMALDPRKGKNIGKVAASSNTHIGSNIESGRLSGGSESSSGVFVRSDGTLQSGTGEVISPPASAVGPGKATAISHLTEIKTFEGGMDGSSHKNPFDTETEAELDTEDETTDDDGDMHNIKRRMDNVEQPGSGMQPLPPPPRIVRIDDGSTTPPASLEPFLNKTNKDQSSDRKNNSSPPLQTLHHHHPPHADVNYQYDHPARRRGRNNSTPPEAPEPPPETPSPTPTFVQVANAPKVDLELQMPRPVPGIPAIRLDPSARKRVEDDDTSTIADSDHHRPDSDAGHRGQPGATPFYPKFSKLKENHRPIDIKNLTSVIAAFVKSGSSPDTGPDIPQFLHMAYQALETATHSPSLDTYLSDARRRLDTRTNQMTMKYNTEAVARKQQQVAQVDSYCNRGATYEEVESIDKRFQQEEAQRKIEAEAQIYQVFENDYVEIAYKDVKGQLEVLGGRWYDEVKTWLLNTAAGAADTAGRPQLSGTAMHYYLLLEAVDLLNKLHVSMEDHEHVLQGLVSDRNQRYLQVSISPLIMQGNTEDAAEAERRFWMDEQGRGLVARADSVKRASDHAAAVERIVSDFIKGLKCKFEEVVRETYDVIFKLPPSTLQTQLFRRFFDDIGSNKITMVHLPDGENLAVPLEIIGVIGDSVKTLSDIVGLIKVSLDLQAQAQIRRCEAQCSLQVVQDYNRKNGVTAPQITSNAVTAGLALVLPGALKRLSEEQGRTVADVLEESMDVVRRLGALVAALKKDPGSSGSSVAGSNSRHGSQAGGSVKTERHQQHNNPHNQVSPRWNEILEGPLWPPSSANVGSGKDTAWAFMAPALVQMPQMPPIHYHHQQPTQQAPQQAQQPPVPPPHQTQPQMQQHPQMQHPQHAQSPGFSLIGSLRTARGVSTQAGPHGLLMSPVGYSAQVPGAAFSPVGQTAQLQLQMAALQNVQQHTQAQHQAQRQQQQQGAGWSGMYGAGQGDGGMGGERRF